VKPARSALLVLLVGMLSFAGGCSTFDRDWQLAAPGPAEPDRITGAWEGSWVSAANGHRGRLRCILTRRGALHYRARYHATFWKVFRYGYTVDLVADPEPDHRWRIEGETDLGWLAGGRYHYQGTVSPVAFEATYECRRDHGTFVLTRPDHDETTPSPFHPPDAVRDPVE